jgi:hypothetical protein
MMDTLISSLWVAMVLYLLYETTVVYSYLKRLPFLNFITHVKDYEKARKDDWSLSYSFFMQYNYGGFMLELLTCRYCLGFWLAFSAAFYCGLQYIPCVYFLSQIGYTGFKVIDKTLTRIGENTNE